MTDLRQTVNDALAVEGLPLGEARRARQLVLAACPDYPPERLKTLHWMDQRYGLAWALESNKTAVTQSGFTAEQLASFVIDSIRTPSERYCHWCQSDYIGVGISAGACADCAEALRDPLDTQPRLRPSAMAAS